MIPPVFTARIAAFIVASVVLAGYVVATGSDARFALVMALTGVNTLLGLLSDVYASAFIGLEVMTPLATVSVAMRLIGLVTTVVVLVLGFGIWGILAIGIANAVITLVAMAWRFRRIARFPWERWRGSIVAVVRTSLPYMAVALAVAVYRQIDIIVVNAVAGKRDVGWYAAADLLAGSLIFPTTVVIASVFPTLGRLHTHDPDGYRKLSRRTLSLLTLTSVPIGLGAAVVGPTFCPLLFGDQFDGTGAAMVVIGPVTILTFGSTLLGYMALASGRHRFLVLLLVFSAVITVPLDAVLVPWAYERFDNGAIGGGLAYVVTESLQFAVGVAVVAPFLMTRTWLWQAARILGAGALMVAATLPFRHQFFLIPAVIGAIVYAAAIVVFRAMDDDQRRLFREAVDRIMPRRHPVGG